MVDVVIVNASPLLTDEEVAAKVAPMQKKFDSLFYPAWQHRIPQRVRYSFEPAKFIPRLPASCRPIFLNRHSKEQGALGWHDDSAGRIYSRVFVGDCIRLGLDWGITLDHEADEMNVDPNIRRVWQMPNGEMAALETDDPVESDEFSFLLDGHRMSNFVYPIYFSTSLHGPFDHGGVLNGPCPELSEGGYQSITKNGVWTQIFANMPDGIPGARALSNGHRRAARGVVPTDLEVVADYAR